MPIYQIRSVAPDGVKAFAYASEADDAHKVAAAKTSAGHRDLSIIDLLTGAKILLTDERHQSSEKRDRH